MPKVNSYLLRKIDFLILDILNPGQEEVVTYMTI